MDALVSAHWLHAHLENSDILILDASLQENKSVQQAQFEKTRIKGARFFDLKNDFSEKNSPYPNTLPSSEDFESACQRLGINRSSKIIVYDHLGVYTSPRVWWMFKTMGHDHVAVLDGGLPNWIAKEYPTEENNPDETYVPGNFKVNYKPDWLASFDQILENTKQLKARVIDARAADRFSGLASEPRKGLRSGHIPNSINIPFEHVLSHGKFKSKAALRTIFKDLDKEEKPLIFSCGSGITACITLLATELIALPNKKAVYDGSWTEWAQKVK